MYVFVGIFCVSIIIGSVLLALKAVSKTSRDTDDPVERIAQLQSWEFIRDMNKNGTNRP